MVRWKAEMLPVNLRVDVRVDRLDVGARIYDLSILSLDYTRVQIGSY
jgi:hypothetical protein